MSIKSAQIINKTDAFHFILSEKVKIQQENDRSFASKAGDKMSATIYIPEGLVPVVIGHKGRQVNQFKFDSGAIIII